MKIQFIPKFKLLDYKIWRLSFEKKVYQTTKPNGLYILGKLHISPGMVVQYNSRVMIILVNT